MPRRWLRARGVSRPAAIRSSAWISTVHIGLAMVDDGQAFADRRFLEGCDAGEYLDAEVRASRRRHGLWQLPGGITRPWEFRRALRARHPGAADTRRRPRMGRLPVSRGPGGGA